MVELNTKDLRAERQWLVWALALSRSQRRRRGIRVGKLELYGRLHAIDHLLKLQETGSPFENRDTRSPQ